MQEIVMTLHTIKHCLKRMACELFLSLNQFPRGAEGILLEILLEGMSEYYSAELADMLLSTGA